MQPLLEVEDLRAHFFTRYGVIKAVDGVSFEIFPGEIVGLAGESGCGKSVTTQCILRILPVPGRIVSGDIRLQGESLLDLSQEEMRDVRGGRISIVLQDALAALNPVITTGRQVADVFQAHSPVSWKEAWQQAVDVMRAVGIPKPEIRAEHYAHEFSGGMQQRTVIAAALICKPDLIIADEPTTALDVTIQMQILNLLKQAQQEMGSSILYISHDLANIARICERVMIMYAGQIVEIGSVRDIYSSPLHPYTRGLMACIPPMEGERHCYLPAISGSPPDPLMYPAGCRFAPRCAEAQERCQFESPPFNSVGDGRYVRCFQD